MLAIAALLVLGGMTTHSGAGAPHNRNFPDPEASASASAPSIIVIGIDSLRCDLTLGPDQAADMPRLNAFLQGAQRFSDTTTPLARTFPSWVSILTGRHPVSTGARVNLTPPEMIDRGSALPKILGRHAYTTVYATDEVRFANIDESYGFDHVISPPIGAADFLLGKLNDLPLSNLLSASSLGKWLFPHTYGNRAAAVTYRPEAFEEMLAEQLPAGQPLFMALHLTLAHWPYTYAGQPMMRSQPKLLRDGYESATTEVDAQFGRIMDRLERQGILDNAIVVVLSDHGEGMGWRTESLLQDVRPMGEIWGTLWGHGTSVMTPHQFQVLLAFRGFGRSALSGESGMHPSPASLEDVWPTLLDLAGLQHEALVDGLSLAPVLQGADPSPALQARIRFTETDFNTPSMLKGQYDEKGALSEAGMYYEVAPDSGWVQLRSYRIPEIIAAKERAAFAQDLLLAALPDGAGGHQFLLTSRSQPFPMTLQGRPDDTAQPGAARLWDALHERFPGEL